MQKEGGRERRGRRAEVELVGGWVWGYLLRGRPRGPSLEWTRRAFWRATSLEVLLVNLWHGNSEWREQTVVRFV